VARFCEGGATTFFVMKLHAVTALHFPTIYLPVMNTHDETMVCTDALAADQQCQRYACK
jgi:hypothetical protein